MIGAFAMGAAGRSAAPEGEAAAIHTKAPAPAMTQRFIAVTPVGSRNHEPETGEPPSAKKPHDTISWSAYESRYAKHPTQGCREMITGESGECGNSASRITLNGASSHRRP